MNASNLNILNYYPLNPYDILSKEEDNPIELYSNDIPIEDDYVNMNDSNNSQTSYNQNIPNNYQSDIDEIQQHISLIIQEITHSNILKINSFKQQNDNNYDLYNQQSLSNSSKKCHKFGSRCNKKIEQRRNNKNIVTKRIELRQEN